MSFVVSIFVVSVIGSLTSLDAWQPDIDFNRVRLITPEASSYKHLNINSHTRRSIFSNRNNDYDNRSSRITKMQPSIQFLPNTSPFEEKRTAHVHQPREDPRLFYQSDAYLKKINRENLNSEVSQIYPGTDVVRADRNYPRMALYGRPYSERLSERDVNFISSDNICVKCPHDRAIILKAGSDRVLLQYPHLKSCSGHKAPQDVKFISMYGPRFGSLLGEGYFGIVGHLSYRNEILQYCYMNVRVMTKTCPLPKYLKADCGDQNNICNFTCSDPKTVMYGQTSLRCKEDMKWNGNLPLCKMQNWCNSPHPPPQGRVSCRGATVNGWGLAEGSTCRVRCARGWKPKPRSLAVCRKGTWTYNLTCILA